MGLATDDQLVWPMCYLGRFFTTLLHNVYGWNICSPFPSFLFSILTKTKAKIWHLSLGSTSWLATLYHWFLWLNCHCTEPLAHVQHKQISPINLASTSAVLLASSEAFMEKQSFHLRHPAPMSSPPLAGGFFGQPIQLNYQRLQHNLSLRRERFSEAACPSLLMAVAVPR